MVMCLLTHICLFISSFVWKSCHWVFASFGSEVFLATRSSQCLRRTQSVVVTGHFLFLYSRSPSRPILSLSVSSFLLGMVICETGSVQEDSSPHVVFVVPPLLWLFSGTGWSPECWKPQLAGHPQWLSGFFFRVALVLVRQ